jgi:twinkle protein
MAFYEVSTKIDEEGKPLELGFKYPNGNPKIRCLDSKHFYTLKGKKPEGLFGTNKFAAGGHSCVTITEGELDALSLWQVLRTPVVSVQSAASALRDCTRDRSFLGSFERIYLAFDNDTAGREALASVAKLFPPGKVFHVKFSNRKDANEYLQAGETKELKTLWENSKRYVPEEILSSFEDFKEVLQEPVKVGVPYPFKILTEMTYGIRTGETVLITAQEKVGKTELMHAIEHQLLKETEDNVAAIFIEEPPLRHLQAIAGIEDKQPYHLPDHSASADTILSTVQKVLKKDDRLYLYSHFGSDDPDVLLDTIRFLVTGCQCRYVLFDHLSMLISGNRGETDERRIIDYVTTRLEMMVKELDFALIMVSHVNDNGQTRGSRYPTKVADIAIGAFRDLQAPDPVERSTVYLRVLFNRFSSTTGPAGKLIFDRDTCTYTEGTFSDGYSSQKDTFASNDNLPHQEGVQMAA